MRTLPVAALAMSLVAAGCGLFSKKHAVSIEEQAVPVGSRWNATLSTPADLSGALQVRGTAWMAPAGANRTRVYISVANAAPGGVHPWHVHHGDAHTYVVGDDPMTPIAGLMNTHLVTRSGDAALMAAAPLLLEALKAIADQEHCLTRHTVDGLRRLARAAIEQVHHP